MSWFALIFISTNLSAFGNLFDKFFCSKKFRSVYTLAVFSSLFQFIFIIGLSFFLSFPKVFNQALVLALIPGLIFFLMWILVWKALVAGEVSRAAAVFQIAPIFNTFLAVIFLGESLPRLKWLAIFLIVAGAVLSSWEGSKNGRFNRAYLFILLAATCSAVATVISKAALGTIKPLTVYALSFYASLPLNFLLLIKKGVWSEVKERIKEKQLMLAVSIRSLILFGAICFYYLALSRGPASLVLAVNGINPLFVFFYSTLVSFLRPKVIKEEIGRRALFLKAVAIILVVGGVIIINQ